MTKIKKNRQWSSRRNLDIKIRPGLRTRPTTPVEKRKGSMFIRNNQN